jgi:SAM-dependent methyltransferase
VSESVYDDRFYDAKEEDVARSARVVVPLVLDLVQPRRVVDVGCGRGGWLSVFRELGVEHVRGLDGAHVDRERLLIDPAAFTAVDLAKPFEIDGSFDLALCLEVAEHLPPAAGPHLVGALVRAAPVVLFSAAVPGQGGTRHVNERWPRYWHDLFAEHGYVRSDAIRRTVCYDQRVKWWYRQNVTLYAATVGAAKFPALQAELEREQSPPLEWVHVKVLERHLFAMSTLRGLARLGHRAAWALLTRNRFRGPNDPQ